MNPLWKQKPADLKDEDYRLDLRLYGAKLLLPMTTKKTVSVDVPRNMHLSGKGIKGSTVIEASPDIKKDDIILIRVNENFNGLGVAKADAADIKNPSQKHDKDSKDRRGHYKAKRRSSALSRMPWPPIVKTLEAMEKDAIDVIKGVVSQGRNRELP